jgi:hypothetical protein
MPPRHPSGACSPRDESVDVDPVLTVLTGTAQPPATRIEVLIRLAASLSRRDEGIEALLGRIGSQPGSPPCSGTSTPSSTSGRPRSQPDPGSG